MTIPIVGVHVNPIESDPLHINMWSFVKTKWPTYFQLSYQHNNVIDEYKYTMDINDRVDELLDDWLESMQYVYVHGSFLMMRLL